MQLFIPIFFISVLFKFKLFALWPIPQFKNTAVNIHLLSNQRQWQEDDLQSNPKPRMHPTLHPGVVVT